MAWGHIGSWGTPELGVTEFISDLLGRPRTQSGGSNVSGSYSYNIPASQVQQSSTPVSWAQQSTPTYTAPSGGTTPPPTNPNPEQNPQPDPYMQWLDQQYSAQEGYINEMESGLGGQKAAREQQAQNVYQQGANTLGTTYQTNKGDIESYQTKTLQDITEALRNMWTQGGRLLGSRGASDSSAAGMYNYALTKLGSKQRGDVMQDVSRRLGNLKSVYDTNMSNLKLELDNQISDISQWYYDALNSVKGMRAQLQQQKSEQALGYAIQMLNDARSQAANKQSILDQWTVNKAQSLPQLQAMLNVNSAAMQPYQGLGANAQFTGAPMNYGLFGFGNQGQDTLNWLQSLIPTK